MATKIKFTGYFERNDDSDDAEEKFMCEVCSAVTKSRKNLRIHKQRFHKDERSFTCDHDSSKLHDSFQTVSFYNALNPKGKERNRNIN